VASPLGHAYAGVAAAWAVDLVPGDRRCRVARPHSSFLGQLGGTLTIICAVLAMLPDLDLAFRAHRTATHSLTAAFIVTIISAAVTAWVTPRPRQGWTSRLCPVGRVALMCGAAYATHLLVDWLSVDPTPPYGIQLFWPFSQSYHISGANLFPRTERRHFTMWVIRMNVIAMAWETAIFAPVLGLLWLVRKKALTRFAAELSGSDHPAQ